MHLVVTSRHARWHVKKDHLDVPIATFADEKDAIKYAVALAKTKPAANVSILDAHGNVVSERRFAMSETH